MKFKSGTRRRAIEYEKALVEYWKENKTFEKSVEQRPADDAYVFYDGPPFITGVPHHGTLLSSIVKDAVPRYQTMKGKRVERVWGWDCHGLPAEVFTEKKLGIHDRRDIGTKISLEEYITTARDNMVQTSNLWNDTIDRIGRWVDMDNAYKTMDKEYMESIWWAFKELHSKGKIYEGERVLMYCTRDATPLSKAEVTMDAGAYQDVTDPSVYVKFKLASNKKRRLLKKDAKVLFVCYGNVARSQIAQAAYDFYLGKKIADSAGTGVDKVRSHLRTISAYADEVNSEGSEYSTTKIVKEIYGIDISGYTRDQLRPEMLKQYDLVVNIAERDQTPDWLVGENVVWWDIRDPGKEEDVWQAVYDVVNPINERVKQLAEFGSTSNDADSIYLLAWTTTPWTLPANTALAVGEDIDYVEVELNGERLILAKDLVEKVLTDEKHQLLEYKVIRELKGKELVGKSYEPLMPIPDGMSYTSIGRNNVSKNNAVLVSDMYRVHAADYVSTESGTGIVHIAPMYGEEDYELAKVESFPGFHAVDESGFYFAPVADALKKMMPWRAEDETLNIWEVNKDLAKAFKQQGLVWKIDFIRHQYPHCHRCGTKLMYRAHPSWFFDVQGQKELMLDKNDEQINWFPEHLKHGRFEKNIEQAPDWNLSRDRFWATAMPVWEGKDSDGNKRQIVVGSYDELTELSGQRLDDYHRPWVDDIEFDKDGVHYKRIDKVIDGWFESGSMPFAQFHYPFENKEKFEANFPGDFIVEYIGQVRAWFYYMHVVSVGLFSESSFRNVITTGTLAGNDGRKMSKSYGNFTDPNELMDQYSADSLRFLLLSSPVLNGEDFALQDKDVGDVARKLSMIWNMYDFFTMYAEVDGWEFDSTKPLILAPKELTNPLDKWIVSRVHQLNKHVTEHMDEYDIPLVMSEFMPFIDDASNWFVRRSRRRFWKSEDDGDKADAYRTLHYVLMKLAVIMAPFTPFLSEELYQKLGGGNESVHLLDWPTNHSVDQQVLIEMATVREYVNQALSLRAQERLKIRQPLASVTVPTLGETVNFEDILTEELNVKKVVQGEKLMLDFAITPELKREGLMREVVRHVQKARKDAGLNVDDRIILALMVKPDNALELEKAIEEYSDAIAEETLTANYGDVQEGYDTIVNVEGGELRICLKKA